MVYNRQVMEHTPDTGSDRDKQMMNSFESLSDKSDKKEAKDKKKKKDGLRVPLFAKDEDEKQHEQRGSIFEPKKPEKEDPKPESHEELDTDIETLTDDETKLAATEYLDATDNDVAQAAEAVADDSPEAAGIEAQQTLREKLREKIEETAAVDEELLEEAVAEARAELGIDEAIEEDDPEATTMPVAATHGGGGQTPPPRPPAPSMPAGGVSPLPPVPPVFPPIGGAATPSAPQAVGNVLQPNPNVLPQRHNRGGDILLGGIIGYLIGRRRGRIKTEGRLAPIQEKLEKEVAELHGKIAEKEERIRTIATAASAEKPEVAPKMAERIRERRERVAVSPETIPKAATLPERIARVIIPKPEIQPSQKSVETLTVPELLRVAQKVEIEGTTLKRMYEVGRMDAVGLRRVVKEYLRDGKYEKRLFENLQSIETNPEFLPVAPGSIQNDGGLSGAGTAAVAAVSNHTAKAGSQNGVPILPSVIEMRQKQQARQQKTAIATIVAVTIGLALVFLLVRQ